MQRMQRITGRFLTRTPNEADVEAMLKDFEDSKVMLEKVRSIVACRLKPWPALDMWGRRETCPPWHWLCPCRRQTTRCCYYSAGYCLLSTVAFVLVD